MQPQHIRAREVSPSKRYQECHFAGIDAPICQDIPLGGTRDGLARAEVCHDTVVDLAGEEAFETPDDLASGPTVLGPSRDVVESRLVVPHADDDGCFRHQLLLPRPYLVLTKPLRLDIQCQRGASVKIGWKYLDD